MTKIQDACKILNEGGVVGMPTETVYGLAGSIESKEGIKNIFATKERPFFDPLIVHVSSVEQAKTYVKTWPQLAEFLAAKLWPGPVTFILPKGENVSDMITSGLDTVGLRMPNHPMALELINTLGHPVAAPSANKFKKTSPTSAEHVQKEFSKVMVLDGGPCEIGIESTVLGIFENKILIYRPGMVSKEVLQNILKDFPSEVEIEYVESPVAPGHLKHHYMPNLPVVLFIGESPQVEDLSEVPKEVLEKSTEWNLPDNPAEVARSLYAKLREMDLKGNTCIIISYSPTYHQRDDWQGILNRLDKAATYKLSK